MDDPPARTCVAPDGQRHNGAPKRGSDRPLMRLATIR